MHSHRRHGSHRHIKHRPHYSTGTSNSVGNFLFSILLLSVIFDADNSIVVRLLTGFFVLLVISLIIYGIYYGAMTATEKFTNPTDLTPGNDEILVALFYADWCGHCKHFKPEFDKVQTALNGNSCKSGKKLKIVKVDCTSDNELSNKHNVRGFPTVKIFGTSSGETEYEGERTESALKSYLLEL